LISLRQKERLKACLAGWDRKFLGEELPTPLLRVRVEANRKCEPGSILINEAGELEGLIANRRLDAVNEGHAIPADLIRKVIDDVENHQKSLPVRIGLIFHSDTSTPQVVEVTEDSPADEAGFETGDVIVEVNDRKIGGFGDLVEALKFLPGRKSASFRVLRDLEKRVIQVIPEFVE
jgi:S1-C subfamily serine protease